MQRCIQCESYLVEVDGVGESRLRETRHVTLRIRV